MCHADFWIKLLSCRDIQQYNALSVIDWTETSVTSSYFFKNEVGPTCDKICIFFIFLIKCFRKIKNIFFCTTFVLNYLYLNHKRVQKPVDKSFRLQKARLTRADFKDYQNVFFLKWFNSNGLFIHVVFLSVIF